MKLIQTNISSYFCLCFFILIFASFVFVYETQVAKKAENELSHHAQILADDLWNYNYQGAKEYLQLAAEAGNYIKISVVNHNGELFQETTTGLPSFWESVGIRLHLIHKISQVSPIQHNNNYIGWIEGVFIPRTLSVHVAVFCFLALFCLVLQLYRGMVSQNLTMEKRVEERTADLLKAKIEAERISYSLEVAGAELQALLDNSPVGILFVDFNRTIKRVNHEVTTISGYSPEELVGSSTRILYGSHEVFESVGEANYPVLDEQGICEAKSEMVRKDGTKIVCYLRGKKVVSEEGIDGVLWCLEDITLRLQMEQELLKVRKLESIGVLAGGIAHDFNNLLVAIIGNMSLAEIMTEKDSKLYELLSSAKKASLRAKDLTGRLLTFASGGEPVRMTGSLPKLLRESASFVLSGSNVKCDFDIADGLWPVRMDKGQISQVIQNLVLNADQSMRGGGVISISAKKITIRGGEVSSLAAGRYVCVTVEDDGAGIAKENLDKIFDPYYSTKEKDSTKGSGLGLSVVHSIITKHEGAITVESDFGKGSTFKIYLPASEETPRRDDETEEYVSFGKGKILIMDDEESVLAVAGEMLSYLGYEHVAARDGAEAVACYENHFSRGRKFDAVIIDLTIPGGMGGNEALIRLLEIDPGVKAIVSTGYSSDTVLQDLEKSGFSSMVLKPYQLKDLSKVLSEVLSE